MKKLVLTTVLAASIGIIGNVNAVPHTFSSGQPARASDVNENFADVESQINNNTNAITTNLNNIANNAAAIAAISVYDYRNFLTDANVISKTFATTGLCGDSEVRTIARTAAGANTNVLITRRRLQGSTTCELKDFSYVNTPTQRLLVEGKNYNPVTSALDATKTPADPIIMASSSMREGATYSSGTTVTTAFTDGVTPAETTVYVDNNSAVSVETSDVVVPLGSYPGCLKISTIRRSNSFGLFHRISWHCPDIGEVKRVQMRIDGSASMTWELTDVIMAAP